MNSNSIEVRNLARLIRISFVELFDKFETVRKIFDWFPSLSFGRIFMTSPSNKVLKLSIVFARVEDCCNFIFGFTIDFDRRWRRLESI